MNDREARELAGSVADRLLFYWAEAVLWAVTHDAVGFSADWLFNGGDGSPVEAPYRSDNLRIVGCGESLPWAAYQTQSHEHWFPFVWDRLREIGLAEEVKGALRGRLNALASFAHEGWGAPTLRPDREEEELLKMAAEGGNCPSSAGLEGDLAVLCGYDDELRRLLPRGWATLWEPEFGDHRLPSLAAVYFRRNDMPSWEVVEPVVLRLRELASGAGLGTVSPAPLIPDAPKGHSWTRLERAILAALYYADHTLDELASFETFMDRGRPKKRPLIGWRNEAREREWSRSAIRNAIEPGSWLRRSGAVDQQKGGGYFRPDAPPGRSPAKNGAAK